MPKLKHIASATAVSGALLAAGLTPTAHAVPRGYWTQCSSSAVGSKLRQHNTSCAEARRVQRAFSLDNTRPRGWDCDFKVTKNFRHLTCSKVPGNAPWVIAWRSLRNPDLPH